MGQLMVRLAVHDEDPRRWIVTRRALALNAVHAADGATDDGLAPAVAQAIVHFFDGVERAVAT